MRLKWLPSLLAILMAGCGLPTSVIVSESFGPEDSLLNPNVSLQVMPLAIAEAGDANPARIRPLTEVLNRAWEPIVVAMASGNKQGWGEASLGLVADLDEVKALCAAPLPGFALDKTRGFYCRANMASGGGATSLFIGNIVLPAEPFGNKLAETPDNKKQAVMTLVAYFYALHLRRVMTDMGLAQTWPEISRAQWCLTGLSLRALLPQAKSLASPAASGQLPVLPLGLTHIFSGTNAEYRYAAWTREGMSSSTVNSCFIQK